MVLQFSRRLRGSNRQLPPVTVSTCGREICCIHEPPHLKQTFVLLESCSILNASEVAASIIVQDRRNFCRPHIWVIEVPASDSSSLWIAERRDDLLRDGMDLWDFARVQECVRDTTECGANIESEDESSRGASVRCAGHRETATLP